jgi:hypothetical protein
MDHLQQNIGALELGAVLATHGDAAVEAASVHMGPPPTHPMMCHHIEDDLMEAMGLELAPSSRQLHPSCRFIGDDVLESAAGLQAQPMTRRVLPNMPCV